MEEEKPVLFILGWIPRRRATASATALFGPWPDSSVFALSSGATPALGCACHHRPQHQERGSSSPSRIRPGSLGGRSAQGVDYGCILVAATPVGECPGMRAIAARRIVTTSDGGGHHGANLAIWRGFSYSLYSSLIFPAHTFMLPLEVMGPGGSLSTLLKLRLVARRQSESVLAGGIVTAANSCDWTPTALVLR
jgi:hypothetical protein